MIPWEQARLRRPVVHSTQILSENFGGRFYFIAVTVRFAFTLFGCAVQF